MDACKIEGCSRPKYGRGLCSAHWQRQRKGRDLHAPLQVRDPNRGCSVDGCTRKHRANGMCATHSSRAWFGNTPLDAPMHERPDGATRPTSHGYIDEKRGGRWRRQHQWRMEDHLGRSLFPDETVHHLNGQRDDNRIENLELWSKAQPAGQRVADKVAFAKAILLRYEVDALTA